MLFYHKFLLISYSLWYSCAVCLKDILERNKKWNTDLFGAIVLFSWLSIVEINRLISMGWKHVQGGYTVILVQILFRPPSMANILWIYKLITVSKCTVTGHPTVIASSSSSPGWSVSTLFSSKSFYSPGTGTDVELSFILRRSRWDLWLLVLVIWNSRELFNFLDNFEVICFKHAVTLTKRKISQDYWIFPRRDESDDNSHEESKAILTAINGGALVIGPSSLQCHMCSLAIISFYK